jgi:diguanylate cyclase (GGDEF)-like protein
MFILDINGLKIINDSFGHHAGNQVLKKLSSVISNYITKENSFVARIGGDEFSVILPNTESKEAEKIMQVIIEKLNQEKVGNINLSIAFGLSVNTPTT